MRLFQATAAQLKDFLADHSLSTLGSKELLLRKAAAKLQELHGDGGLCTRHLYTLEVLSGLGLTASRVFMGNGKCIIGSADFCLLVLSNLVMSCRWHSSPRASKKRAGFCS